MRYTFKVNNQWEAKGRKALTMGLTLMATDIHQMAVTNAPKLTHALANSGRMTMRGLTATITFGNSRVDYAELRERENHKHPSTTRYLERAGQAAMKKVGTYFREI